MFCFKKYFLGALIGSICLLSGCGQGDILLSEPLTGVVEDSGKGQPDEMGETKIGETYETSEEVWESIVVPVNNQAEEITYLCEDGIDPLRVIHRCVSGGENVFLAYNETDIYVMSIGAGKHSPAGISNPNMLNVCNVAVDTYGRTHLLMAGSDYEEWYIWRLDEEYQVDKVINISEYFETKQIPIWFLIDKNGYYYFQWPYDRSGLVVDGEGVIIHKLTTQTLEVSWIYEAAVGRDGEIYLAFSMEDDQIKIGRLDVENGSLDKKNVSGVFPAQETFSLMGAGTDTNLLLFSPYSGIWACDMEKGIFENRVELSDKELGEAVEYWPLTFLPDGRMLALGKSVGNDSSETADFVMKYIPAGR